MTEPRSKKRRGWLLIVGVLIAAVVLLFALLPSVLSSQWGKGRVLGMAAPHIPGEVQVDSWSLSWFGSQRLDGIHYTDQDGALQASVSEVSVAKGLFSFVLDRGNLGTVTVTRPDIQIRLPEPPPQEDGAEPTPAPDGGPAGPVEPPTAEGQTPPAPGSLSLPPISGRLLVEDGIVSVFKSGQSAERVATDINLDVTIASVDDISYSLAMASADGAGTVSGAGKIMVQGADTVAGSIRPAGDLQIKNWDITQLLELASSFGPAPAGSGILGSTISFDGSLSEGINLQGGIDLVNLELHGGPLGADRPFMDQTSVEFTSLVGSNWLELSSLTLASPLASGTMTASVATQGPVQFGADLQVNLQEVASQIPETLSLQEGLQITGGLLAIEGQLQSQQGVNKFTVDGRVEGLAGIREGQKISLSKPFTLSLDGQQGQGGLRLENFAVRSSFLEGEGQGDLNDLQLSLNADLGAALAEISKFIDLQNYEAEGRLAVSLEAQRKDEATVALTAQLEADTLTVQQGTMVIIPPKSLKTSAAADLLLSGEFEFGGIGAGELTYQAWLGRGTLTGRDLLLGSEKNIQSIGELKGDNQLRLGDLGVMLNNLGLAPEGLTLQGNSKVTFKVSGENNKFILSDLVIDAAKLSVKKGTVQLIPESRLTIQGGTGLERGADGAISTVDAPQFSYQSWLGSGTVEAASMEVPTTQLKDFTFAGQTDLAKLAELFSVLELLPADMSFSGLDSSKLTLDYSPEKIDLASLRTEIDDFVFTQQGKTYRDKKVVIETSGAVEMGRKAASFSPLHIDSANGAISLEKLVVEDWSKALDTLSSTGQARFDLLTVLEAAADWVSLPPDVTTGATVDLNWAAAAEKDSDRSYRISADLNDFSLAKKELQAFSGEKVALQLDGLRNPATGQLTLNQFTIASPMLDFDAAGFWNQNAGIDTEFSFDGDLGMDLARIATLVRTFTEIDLEMAGKSARPFKLRGAMSQEQAQQWWRHVDFNGSFQADLIKILGVELSSLEIPVQVANGTAQAQVQGRANQGELVLKPQLDMMSEPPVLTIPDNSQILNKMQITREMANQLLARIHPLFMGASQMSGTVDLHLERFNWPLGKDSLNDLQFAGFMDFNEVRLESSAMLGALLQALRVQDTGIDLSGRQIRFEAKDGRIETNPLRTNLSDSELVISGSLGLDTTIDYLAQVEVTERLVGGDLYNYLEGTMINVPIGGTLAKPDISAQTVQRTITDLINQAGQKKLQEAAGSLLKKLF